MIKEFSNIITGDETWLYFFEPQRKVDNKMWIKKDGVRPVIAKRVQSSNKVLYAIFFNSGGPVLQILIPKGRSVTGKFYRDSVLKRVQKFYNKRRPKLEFKGYVLCMTMPLHTRAGLFSNFWKRKRWNSFLIHCISRFESM